MLKGTRLTWNPESIGPEGADPVFFVNALIQEPSDLPRKITVLRTLYGDSEAKFTESFVLRSQNWTKPFLPKT